MIDAILWPILSIGGMGLIFGVVLAYASKKFAYEKDPLVESIMDALPGINCGSCGYPKCEAIAAAVVAKEAPVGGCVVGGTHVAQRVAGILGVDVYERVRKHAKVLCQGGSDRAMNKYIYNGVRDCTIAVRLGGGPKGCRYGCLGMGTCVRACAFDAIHINDKNISVVDSLKCTSCGMCVKACPKKIIALVPSDMKAHVLCMSKERGKKVSENCKIGCIACKLCVKACKYDAIVFTDNLARIDYEKCVNCMACVRACPTGAIQGLE